MNPDRDEVTVKAVLDANILISSFISSLFTGGGLSSEIFELARIGKFHLYTAESILEEVRSILLEENRIFNKYNYTKDDVDEFIQVLRAVSYIVKRLPNISIIERDPEDNKILACAIASKSHYVVTRDMDLLDLGSYKDIKIIKPELFIHLIRPTK